LLFKPATRLHHGNRPIVAELIDNAQDSFVAAWRHADPAHADSARIRNPRIDARSHPGMTVMTNTPA